MWVMQSLSYDPNSTGHHKPSTIKQALSALVKGSLTRQRGQVCRFFMFRCVIWLRCSSFLLTHAFRIDRDECPLLSRNTDVWRTVSHEDCLRSTYGLATVLLLTPAWSPWSFLTSFEPDCSMQYNWNEFLAAGVGQSSKSHCISQYVGLDHYKAGL